MSLEAMKIIVVDDDPVFRKAVIKILKANGFRVFEEAIILAVIKSILRESPDLMLLDLYMLKARGIEIIKTMRRMRIDLPVVIISGRISHHDLRILQEYGVTDFLVKPITMKTLLAKVRKVLKTTVS